MSLRDLNTRDILLLAQLVEEQGTANTAKLYNQYICHPTYKLSHYDDPVIQSEQEFSAIVTELLTSPLPIPWAMAPGKEGEETKQLPNILQICEYYYLLRQEEILKEMDAVKQQFETLKQTL